MKTLSLLLSTIALSHLLLSPAAAENPVPAKKRTDIYDQKANGQKQIADALAKAKAENKRVILKFGANWCGWCHKLSDLFKKDSAIATKLNENYILVLIDVDQVEGKPHNADIVTRYSNPTQHGLPVLVVLDSDGKQLHTQDTALLEDGDHHDPAKVMNFLEKWKPIKKS
jgi:thiol:disulfide interchange protein